MSTQFFGQYLLANGAVTPQQLDSAVAYQRTRNLRLGELAVAKGWLSVEQADEINAMQRRLDQRFGSLATELGLLSEDQVDELMRYQASMHLHLGEALVEKGLISEEAMTSWLSEFERQRRQFGRDIERFLATVPHAEIVIPTIDLATKLFARVAHQPALIHGCAIGGVRWPPHPYAVSQRFTGHRQGTLTLSLTEPLLLWIGSKMMGMELTEMSALALDAAAEFLNTISGNLVARLSHSEYVLDLDPPLRAPSQPDDRAVCTTFVTPSGEAALHVLLD